MTKDEQYSEIGRNTVERDNLNRELNCIRSKIRRFEKILRETADVLEQRVTMQADISLNPEFPMPQQIEDLLSDHSRVCGELMMIEDFFRNSTIGK